MRSIPAYFIVCLVLLVTSLTTATMAQAPRSMSFQGYLTDTAGTAIDVPQDLMIRLFDVEAGGSSVWARTYTSVPVDDGGFTVVLENGAPSFETVSFDDSLWIEVEVDA